MADDVLYKSFKFNLLIIKLSAWSLGLGFGGVLLCSMTSGAKGFNFLGISFLVLGIMSLILTCVDCATIDHHEEVFLIESICCGVPLYILLLSLGIFALAVSKQGSEKSLPTGNEYTEYDLSSYSKWLQNKVNDTYRWENYYKKTLIKHHVCRDMTTKYSSDTLDEFYQRSINSFESGCCKPSEECGFNYTSPTVWIKPKEDRNYKNMDCYNWSNDPSTLCFNCESCKAAFAQDVKENWFKVGVICAAILALFVFLIFMYVLILCSGT